MTNKETLISDLAMFNVHLDKMDICHFVLNGKQYNESVTTAQNIFQQRIDQNRTIFFELWHEIINLIRDHIPSVYLSNDSTQHLFINAIKNIYLLSKRFSLKGKKHIVSILNKDCDEFSEDFMIECIDRSICVFWVYQLIRIDLLIIKMLEQLSVTKEASGSVGHIDLTMQERVYPMGDYPPETEPDVSYLHPLWTRKFLQYDIQHGKTTYNIEDEVYRNMNEPYGYKLREERQPNRELSRVTTGP